MREVLAVTLAFDSLFENRGSLRNQSVLDRVMARAATLSQQVSASDKSKLDEYLTSVRSIETSMPGASMTVNKVPPRIMNQWLISRELAT